MQVWTQCSFWGQKTKSLVKRRVREENGRDVHIFSSRQCHFAPWRIDAGKKTSGAPGTPDNACFVWVRRTELNALLIRQVAC